MGVDYSSYLGYGFKLSPETVEYLKELDQDGDGLEEYLYHNLPSTLELVTAGSYYDSKPNEYIISVRSKTKRVDSDDAESYVRLDTPILETQEGHDLFHLHAELEAKNNTPVGPFFAGLWH